MGSNHPESVEVALERLYRSPLVEIPHTNGFVFADGEYQILVRVKETRRGVLEVAAAGVDFPSLGVCKPSATISQVPAGGLTRTAHPPELDQSIVTCRHNQRQCRVERHPVHTTVMTLQHKFHNGIRVAEHISLIGVCTCHLIFEGDGGRSGVLLSQAGDVPDADGLVEGSGGDEVLGRVELSAHNIMIVPGHGAD